MTDNMKRTFGIISCIVALCTFSGCINNTCESDSVAYEVCFSPAVMPTSRYEVGVYPSDRLFGVWAFALPNNMTWGADASSAQSLIDGEVVAYDGAWWRTSTTYMWPEQSRLSIFAWSPFDLAASFDKTKGICFNGFDLLNSDVKPMFSASIINKSCPEYAGIVAVPFQHALAQVEFRLNTTYDLKAEVRVKSVNIGGIFTGGNFHSLPAPEWETMGETTNVEFCDGECVLGHSSIVVGEGRWMLPQRVHQSVEVVYDLYNENGSLVLANQVVTSKPMCAKWEVGRSYSYCLTLKHGEVVFNTEKL